MADTTKMCEDCQRANQMTKAVIATKNIPSADDLLYEQFKKELSQLCITDDTRGRLTDLLVAALKMTPVEKVEETPIKEENVVCKLFLKGYPNVLGGTVESVLKSLNVKNKNGYTDYEKTSEYVMTLMIEKVKKG